MRRLILLTPSFVAVACSANPAGDPFDPSSTAADADAGASDDDAGASEATGDDPSGGEESSTGAVDPSDGDDATTTPLDETGALESSESESGDDDVCGDGIVGPSEVCEASDFDGATCATLGFMSGELVCSDDCKGFSTEDCYICGDGEVSLGEQCDTVFDDDVTCQSAGYTEGEISCNFATCQYDVSGCSLCGNGAIEGNEACEPDDLGGATCASLGFDGGDLGCSMNSCGYDYSGCEGGMYIQGFEDGVLPAEFSVGGTVDFTVTMTNPIAGSWSAENGNIEHGETSSMFLTTLFSVAGTVEFMHEGSSENNYDYLRFFIDGDMQDEWSGEVPAAMASYDIAAGMHELEWRYSKDGSVHAGADSVWVDDIVLTNGAPVP